MYNIDGQLFIFPLITTSPNIRRPK